MKHFDPSRADAASIDEVTDLCGTVAIDCARAAGVLQLVSDSSTAMREGRERLQQTVAELVAEHDRISEACDDSRKLSEMAIDRLRAGEQQLADSLAQVLGLVGLLDRLGEHVTGFASAMEQVKATSVEIGEIADATHILALNAGIEADRSGEAGRSFRVIAEEVKALSANTRFATDSIAETIGELDGEAQQMVRRMKLGATAARKTRKTSAQVSEMFAGVGEIVEEVDRQNEQIAAASVHSGAAILSVGEALAGFDKVARSTDEYLDRAQDGMKRVEWTASDMFDSLVKAGLSPQDAEISQLAREYAAKFTVMAEQAIEAGGLSVDQLFDQDYCPIEGSNPPRFRTSLTDWANRHWRPVIDDCLARGRPIKMLALADEHGFLPTHATERSREPTGDIAHDTLWCRNGRKLLGSMDTKARLSDDAYMMAVHRQEGDGVHGYVVRNAYVPIRIAGRRWGIMELAYILDEAAWPKQ